MAKEQKSDRLGGNIDRIGVQIFRCDRFVQLCPSTFCHDNYSGENASGASGRRGYKASKKGHALVNRFEE
ncbi:MAG: hypothetical protein DI535_20230 [Citrobacter freundii]|nr:MAG: hypothetical protein DI535_20230 [Citrobacter freundii]